MIVRYLDPIERLEYEIIQRGEQGSETWMLSEAFEQLKSESAEQARETAQQVLVELMERDAVTPEDSTAEPDDLDAISLASGSQHTQGDQARHTLSEADLYNKILGGWLGRAAGCLLGKPVERYARPVLREMLESNGNWPLEHYWTQQGMPEDILQRYPWKLRGGLASLRENIQCMPEDDDLNYVMLNLHVMEKHGSNFSSDDIGTAWLTTTPAYQVFTAERVAYFNLLDGRSAPDSATYMNPFREWIGAQIRSDLWAYVSPGNPHQATEFAWRDARLSHSRNGIYGEMFFSALIASAFVESDLRRLVQSALGFVPVQSRFAAAIRVVLDLPISSMEWEEVVDKIYEHFGAYHWVHSINNAALTVAALLAGGGDYERTICYTVMGGWDTDSNGATAGSIIGVIQGAASLPDKWIKPLDNRIHSSLSGFDNSKFTDLAQRTLTVAQQSEDQHSDGLVGRSDDF